MSNKSELLPWLELGEKWKIEWSVDGQSAASCPFVHYFFPFRIHTYEAHVCNLIYIEPITVTIWCIFLSLYKIIHSGAKCKSIFSFEKNCSIFQLYRYWHLAKAKTENLKLKFVLVHDFWTIFLKLTCMSQRAFPPGSS